LDQINCSQPVAAILNSITDTSGCTTSNWSKHFPFIYITFLCNIL
jgi:hypothetical protein